MLRTSAVAPARRVSFRRVLDAFALRAVLVAAALTCVSSPGWAALRFHPPVSLSAGPGVRGVALADLNADDMGDVVIVNGTAGSVSVHLATSPGIYGAGTHYTVGTNPRSVAVEDMNGDGTRDLVVTNTADNTFSVLLGNGDGTFQEQEVHATGLGPTALLLVEITGDAYPDVVVANSGEQSVSVIPGGESGAFGTRVDVALPGAPSAVVAEELDGLAGLDLAVACAPNLVAVVGGDWAGHFTLGDVLTVGADPRSVIARDVNDDGIADLVTANHGDNTLSVLVSTSVGEFAPATSLSVGAQPSAVAFEDMDYDGWNDLVSVQAGDGTVSVFRGHGTGLFPVRHDLPASASPTGLLIADANLDGYLDYFTWDESVGTVDLYLMNPILGGQVVWVEQPSSFVAGTIMPGAVRLRVTDELGEPVIGEPVWLWMDGGGDLLNGTEEALTDADGIATFSGLSAVIAGQKFLYGWIATLSAPNSDVFVVSPAAPSILRFAVQPTDGIVNTRIQPPVRVQVTDAYTNAIAGEGVSLALDGAGALAGAGERVSDSEGYATFDSLSVNTVGTFRLIATSGATMSDTSVTFAVFGATKVLQFAARQPISVGYGPMGVAVGDLDGDGIPDLVNANSSQSTVSVTRGLGSGLFATAVTYSTGASPMSVRLADLDEDGRLDIITTDRGSSSVSVLRGLGGAVFAGRVAYATGLWPWSFTVADLNSDGHLDLAVANEGVSVVSLLFGDGHGAFAAAVPLAPGFTPMGIDAGDVDGDGFVDLVVSGARFQLGVLAGDGQGHFSLNEMNSGMEYSRFLALADFDEDGRLDVVTAGQSEGAVAVRLRKTAAGFSSQVTYATDGGPYNVSVGDVDGDGHRDLVTSSYLSSKVSVLLGTGRGSFFATQSFPAAPFPGHVIVADMNADGAADLVTADNNMNTVSLYFQNATPASAIAFVTQPSTVVSGQTMTPAVRVKVTGGSGQALPGLNVTLSLVGAGTLVGGGPIATGADGIATFSSLRVDSAGSHQLIASCTPTLQVTSNSFNVSWPVRLFADPRQFAVGPQPRALTAADLNGDAALDLVVSNSADNTISILLGNGDGTYAPKVDLPAANGPGAIRVVDLNRDGRLDLVVSNAATYAFSTFLGNGNGTFQARVDVSPGNSSRNVAVGDLNLDGKLDVVTSTSGVNYLTVRLGNGDGTFGPRVDVTAAVNCSGILIHDLDRDGFPDVTTASISEHKVVVLRGNGNGTFRPVVTFDAGNQPWDLIGGDWNGDGKMDVATANYDSNTVSILLGNGDGTFAPRTQVRSGIQPYRLAAADLDRDGRLDIVSANMSTTISVFRGLGNGAFVSKDDYVSQSSGDVVLADLDSNGSIDMAAPNYLQAKVSVFLNTMSLPTPTLIELFRAAANNAGVRVEWQLSDAAALRACALERASSEAGEWFAVAEAPRTEGALQVVVDAEAPAGVTSWYRLRGTLRSGAAFTYGPVSAEGLALVRTLELATPWPNPSRGATTLSFGLPARANVRLSLVDLQGREVALLADGLRDAGRHMALLDANDLSPGIYFARLQSAGEARVRRLVIVK